MVPSSNGLTLCPLRPSKGRKHPHRFLAPPFADFMEFKGEYPHVYRVVCPGCCRVFFSPGKSRAAISFTWLNSKNWSCMKLSVSSVEWQNLCVTWFWGHNTKSSNTAYKIINFCGSNKLYSVYFELLCPELNIYSFRQFMSLRSKKKINK